MDVVHFHLVINHLPIMGTVLAVPLLLVALVTRGNLGTVRAVVLLLVLAGVGAGAAFSSGELSEEVVEELPGTYETAMETHEERATVATAVSVAVAVGALVVWAVAERRGYGPPMALAGLMLATTVSAGTMAWTGVAGGQIRHPEVRPEQSGPMV